jgi:PAS domain S-box-containing protein
VVARRITAAWRGLVGRLATPDVLESLFDRVPDAVFFVKDRRGRYVVVNETLLQRCGIPHRQGLLGRTVDEVFPAPLGTSYAAQDRLVVETGVEIRDKLELHLYPGGSQGWCLTFKTPLRDTDGTIIGLVGISRDVQGADARRVEYRRLADAVEHMKTRYSESVRLEMLARVVGLSLDRFERLVKEVFGLTPRQLLTQTRVEAASRLLRDSRRTISDIAHDCGYSDHSAFTRQFRTTVGLTPRDFRDAARRVTTGGPAARSTAS